MTFLSSLNEYAIKIESNMLSNLVPFLFIVITIITESNILKSIRIKILLILLKNC